jgi:hypothetical protein
LSTRFHLSAFRSLQLFALLVNECREHVPGATDAREKEELSHLDRLKDEMKKEAALLVYVPLDKMEVTNQTAVSNTVCICHMHEENGVSAKKACV